MRTNEKAGRRVGSEQGVSAPPLSSCLPSPRFFVCFFFLLHFLEFAKGSGGSEEERAHLLVVGVGVVQNR